MSSVVSDPKTLEEYDGQPDTEYDDLIHDISDPEEEFEEDDGDVWEKTWKSFEKACVDEGTNSLAVFGTHIYGINSHLGSDLTALTSRLSIKEILELTNKIKVKTPEPPKPSFVVIRLFNVYVFIQIKNIGPLGMKPIRFENRSDAMEVVLQFI